MLEVVVELVNLFSTVDLNEIFGGNINIWFGIPYRMNVEPEVEKKQKKQKKKKR